MAVVEMNPLAIYADLYVWIETLLTTMMISSFFDFTSSALLHFAMKFKKTHQAIFIFIFCHWSLNNFAECISRKGFLGVRHHYLKPNERFLL